MCIIAAALLAGCGGGSKASSPFADVTPGDQERVRQMSRELNDFDNAAADIQAAKSLAAEEIAYTTMTAALGHARDYADALTNPTLHRETGAYLDAAENYTDSIRALLDYTDPAGSDAATESTLTIDARNATRALERSTRRLTNIIVDASPPGERPKLRAQLREAQKQLRARASGS